MTSSTNEQRSLKIIMSIHHSLDKNTGAPGVVMQLTKEFSKLGHSAKIQSHENLGRAKNKKIAGALYPILCAYHFKKNYDEIDVIDASAADLWLFGSINRRLACPLLVTHSHGLEHIAHENLINETKRSGNILSWKYPIYRGGIRLWEVKKSFQNSDLCLFLNKNEMRYAIENLGLKADRCFLVPNGVDDALLDDSLEICPPEITGAVRIALLGRYSAMKGAAYGAKALNRFLTRFPKATVMFLGTGCGAELIQADFQEDLWSRITVAPNYVRESLSEHLAGVHILLFPSLSEGFPLSPGEAMARGLAPVASAIPGVTEIINHMESGILVPPADSAAIEQALTQLVEQPDLLQSLRLGARQRAMQFRWRDIAQQRINLYREFIARKQRDQQ